MSAVCALNPFCCNEEDEVVVVVYTQNDVTFAVVGIDFLLSLSEELLHIIETPVSNDRVHTGF